MNESTEKYINGLRSKNQWPTGQVTDADYLAAQEYENHLAKARFEALRYGPTEGSKMTTQDKIAQQCDAIKEMLLAKNRKYGDIALNPVRVFSKADAAEQIKVRLDDKLSRLRSSQSDEDEDVIADLIGYLILLRIAKEQYRGT